LPDEPFDPDLLERLTRELEFARFLRVMWRKHEKTPLGLGFGSSRFSSSDRTYKVLYAAQDLATAIAEVIVRDRFEAVPRDARRLHRSEIEERAVAEIATVRPLRVLDLRRAALFKLGFDTDAVGARAHAQGQALSARVHAETTLDGMIYLSRLLHVTCIVFFERAVPFALEAPRAYGLERAPDLAGALAELEVRPLP
jgi:RES domain